MAPALKLTLDFTNVVTGQAIPLSFNVTVSYCNGTRDDAILSVSCGGASVTPPSRTVAPGAGTADFTVTHTAPGTGHTLAAALTQNGTPLVGTQKAVNVA